MRPFNIVFVLSLMDGCAGQAASEPQTAPIPQTVESVEAPPKPEPKPTCSEEEPQEIKITVTSWPYDVHTLPFEVTRVWVWNPSTDAVGSWTQGNTAVVSARCGDTLEIQGSDDDGRNWTNGAAAIVIDGREESLFMGKGEYHIVYQLPRPYLFP